MEATVNLPPGFKLDPIPQGVNLPPGFSLDAPTEPTAPPESPSVLGRFASRTGFAGLSQVPGAISDIAGQGVMGGAKALAGGLAGTLGQYAGEFAPSAIASQYKHLRTQGDTPEGQAQGLVNMSPVGAAAGSIPLFGKMAETISSDVVQGKIPEIVGDIFSAAPMLLGSRGFRGSKIANAPIGEAVVGAAKRAAPVAREVGSAVKDVLKSDKFSGPAGVAGAVGWATGNPYIAAAAAGITRTIQSIAKRRAEAAQAVEKLALDAAEKLETSKLEELKARQAVVDHIETTAEQTKTSSFESVMEGWKAAAERVKAEETAAAKMAAIQEKYRGLDSPEALKLELDAIRAKEIDNAALGVSPGEYSMHKTHLAALAEDMQTRGAGKQGAAMAQAQIAAGAENIATRGLGRTELPKTQAQIAAEAQNTATRNLGPNQYPVEQARIAAGAEDAATRGLGSTEFPKTQAQIAAGEADITNRGVSPLQVRMEQARIEARKVQDASRGLSPNELALTQDQIAAQAANRGQRGVSPNEFETSQAQIAAKAEEAKRLKAAEAAAPVEDGVLKAVEGEKPAPKDGVLKAVEKPKTPKTDEIIKGIETAEDPARVRKAHKAMARIIEFKEEKIAAAKAAGGEVPTQYDLKSIVEGLRKSKNHDGVSEATMVKMAQGMRERLIRARRAMTSLVNDGTSLKEAAAAGDLDLDMPSEFNIKVVRDAARARGDKLNAAQRADLAEIEKMSNIRKTGESWYLPKKP